METDKPKRYKLKKYPGYSIAKDGSLYKEGKRLKPYICNGYELVRVNNQWKTVHRVVAKAFIPNPDEKPYVNHINSIKTDNRVENLEWVTQKENCAAHGKQISHPKRVVQMDKTGKILNTYNSMKEAGDAIGFSASAISKAVLKINSSAGGYYWDYEGGGNTIGADISKGKPVYDNNKYCIFPDGRVYNTVRCTYLKPVLNASGYAYVTISSGKEKRNHYIHRIVAEHFIENPDPIKKTQVNHINKKRDDNRIENLEWVTPSENLIHAKCSIPSS